MGLHVSGAPGRKKSRRGAAMKSQSVLWMSVARPEVWLGDLSVASLPPFAAPSRRRVAPDGRSREVSVLDSELFNEGQRAGSAEQRLAELWDGARRADSELAQQQARARARLSPTHVPRAHALGVRAPKANQESEPGVHGRDSLGRGRLRQRAQKYPSVVEQFIAMRIGKLPLANPARSGVAPPKCPTSRPAVGLGARSCCLTFGQLLPISISWLGPLLVNCWPRSLKLCQHSANSGQHLPTIDQIVWILGKISASGRLLETSGNFQLRGNFGQLRSSWLTEFAGGNFLARRLSSVFGRSVPDFAAVFGRSVGADFMPHAYMFFDALADV